MSEFRICSRAHGEPHVLSVQLNPSSLLIEIIEPWKVIENIWCDVLPPILFQEFRSVRGNLIE